MRYRVLTASDASTYFLAKRGGTTIEVDSLVRFRGSGSELDQTFVATLRGSLAALRSSWPDGLKNDKERNAFEASASRLVHSTVPACAELLCDPDFWIWFAVVHFQELVEWRYGSPESGTKLVNYGIGSRTENLLYRLWLRAELVLDDDASDPYHLCDAGQIDFYRSHLFRQGYANVRNFARALIRYQYPYADFSEPKLKISEIRDLVKRLRRLRSNLFVEILPEDECRAVIEAEAAVVMSN